MSDLPFFDGSAGKKPQNLQLSAGSDKLRSFKGSIRVFGPYYAGPYTIKRSFKIELKDESVRNYLFKGHRYSRKLPDPLPGLDDQGKIDTSKYSPILSSCWNID